MKGFNMKREKRFGIAGAIPLLLVAASAIGITTQAFAGENCDETYYACRSAMYVEHEWCFQQCVDPDHQGDCEWTCDFALQWNLTGCDADRNFCNDPY
jgi:hypothetical protein